MLPSAAPPQPPPTRRKRKPLPRLQQTQTPYLPFPPPQITAKFRSNRVQHNNNDHNIHFHRTAHQPANPRSVSPLTKSQHRNHNGSLNIHLIQTHSPSVRPNTPICPSLSFKPTPRPSLSLTGKHSDNPSSNLTAKPKPSPKTKGSTKSSPTNNNKTAEFQSKYVYLSSRNHRDHKVRYRGIRLIMAVVALCMRRCSSARVRASLRGRGGRGSLLLFFEVGYRPGWVMVERVRGGEVG